MSSYKQRTAILANLYWRYRKIDCSEHTTGGEKDIAKRMERLIWDAMGNVRPDALPEWVKPELVSLADRLALKERTPRDDLPGSPIVCRGTWPFNDSGYGMFRWLGDGWEEIEGLDTFNVLARHDGLWAIVTYCEGDLTLDVFKTEAEYRGYLTYCRSYYERMAR